MAIDHTATNTYAGTRYAPRNTARTVADAASPKQQTYISDMVREIHRLQVRELQMAQGTHAAQDVSDAIARLGSEDDAVRTQFGQTFTYGETGTINRLIAARNRHRKMSQEMARRAAPAVAAPGVAVAGSVVLQEDKTYRAPDGRVIRVVRGGSGYLYGKVWTPETQSFEYFAGIRSVVGMVEMTLAEAKEFGQLTGQCCVCCTVLEDTVSIALGIGPVCESRYTGRARSRGKAFRASVLAEYAERMAAQAPAAVHAEEDMRAEMLAIDSEPAPF